jgi:hypothetical protein
MDSVYALFLVFYSAVDPFETDMVERRKRKGEKPSSVPFLF